MKYLSLGLFVDDVTRSLQQQDRSFTVLDITDPAAETRLEGHFQSRFHPSLVETFDRETIVKLLKAAKESPHIDEVFLGYLAMDHRVYVALIDLFKTERQWKRLSVQGCVDHVAEVCVALIATSCHVESLCLYYNELDYSGFSSLAMALALNPSKLVSLEVKDYLSHDAASALSSGLEKNSTLKNLNLSGCRFQDGAISQLVPGLSRNRHLQSIQWQQCHIQDGDVATILSSLRDHPKISGIDLDCNFCHSNSFEVLASMLENNYTVNLTSLSVGHQHFLNDNSNSFQLDVSSLAKVMCTNTSLRMLSLSRNIINHDDIVSLMMDVKVSSHLEDLRLKSCNITDESVSYILKNIPTSLKYLNIGDNPFGNETTQALLLDVVKSNQLLERLIIDKQRIGCWREVDYYIRMNIAGRRILSCSSDDDDDAVPKSLWSLIFHRINNQLSWERYDDTTTNDATAIGYAEDAIYFFLINSGLFWR